MKLSDKLRKLAIKFIQSVETERQTTSWILQLNESRTHVHHLYKRMWAGLDSRDASHKKVWLMQQKKKISAGPSALLNIYQITKEHCKIPVEPLRALLSNT